MRQLRCLFGVLMTLMNNAHPVGRKELAEKFEINERTVSRYIDAMSVDCGIPVTTTYGAGGGYSIADNYKLEQSFFTLKEYERILTCLHAVSANFSDGLTNDIIDKFKNLSGNMENERYLLKSDTLVIDAGPWNDPGRYRSTMTVINKAIESFKTLSMSYIDKHDSRSQRLFDPYSLVLKEGIWYTYGWCHAREDFRLFKLARIKDLNSTDTDFKLREGGDVYQKLSEQFIDRPLITIELSLDSSALNEVEEWLGVDNVKPDKENTFCAKAKVYSDELLIKRLMNLGSHIKVIKPDYIREELQVECKRLLLNYN